MSYGRHPFGATSYSGAANVAGSTGGGVVTDPANPEGSGWRWRTRTALGPYGAQAYGGAGAIVYPSSGGISATADPLLGQIRLSAWWANAPYLRVARLVEGTRSEVRGAYPVTVVEPTRRNRCTNPSFEVNAAGWLAGANTTLSRITETAMPDGTSAGRLKATAAGAVTATVPVALPLPEGPPYVSFGLRLSAAPSGALTASVAWQDATGASLGSTLATIASGALAAYVNRWDRTPVLTMTVPMGADNTTPAVTGTMTISVAGMAANATADLDAVLVEGGSSDGTFFDGDYQYAAWLGTPNASSSTLAPVVQFVDKEAPLDVPVQYELSAPDQPGYVATSEPVILPSNDVTWLSHPVTGEALQVTILEEPEVSRPIDRGVHKVIGRRYPVAVSASQRRASEGTLEVLVVTFAERDAVWDLLDDGQPLLLRAPARLGHGPSEWVSIGDATLTRPGHGAWEDARIFKLPYSVVDAPPANPEDPALEVA
jgi:hypothetical protein